MRFVEWIDASPHEFGVMVHLLSKQLGDRFPGRHFFIVEDWERVKRDAHVDDVVIHLPSTDDAGEPPLLRDGHVVVDPLFDVMRKVFAMGRIADLAFSLGADDSIFNGTITARCAGVEKAQLSVAINDRYYNRVEPWWGLLRSEMVRLSWIKDRCDGFQPTEKNPEPDQERSPDETSTRASQAEQDDLPETRPQKQPLGRRTGTTSITEEDFRQKVDEYARGSRAAGERATWEGLAEKVGVDVGTVHRYKKRWHVSWPQARD